MSVPSDMLQVEVTRLKDSSNFFGECPVIIGEDVFCLAGIERLHEIFEGEIHLEQHKASLSYGVYSILTCSCNVLMNSNFEAAVEDSGPFL